MAISISEQYPGKTAGNTTNYPLGEARNVTTPGDGTGTPWEQAIVNDDQGFKQALLAAAGLTPSGTPDTALVSQYLQALQTIIANAISSAVPRKVYAWVRFGYIGGSIVIQASSGVSSVTRLAVGKYRINFSTPVGGTGFAVTGNAQQVNNTGASFPNVLVPMTYNAAYVEVWTGDNSEDQFYDTANANVVVYR